MAFATIDKGSKYFNIILRNGGGGTFTGLGFQPDLVWQKARSTASSHYLHDAVRGVTKALFTNSTSAETTYTDQITSFDTDGFTVNAGGDWGSGTTVVDWCWKANGAGVSNTAGSITSTVSANTTSGFSIVSYTGTGANATVGHGLGVAPDMIICKSRTQAQNWATYHSSLGNTKALFLDGTGAATTSSSYWNNTSPTSTVFTVGNSGDVNFNAGTQISYCFSSVKGYSKFGSYTGNGSADGTFIYTGFKPAFFLNIRTDTTASVRFMFDNKRNTFNVVNADLYANTDDSESNTNRIDFLSNGFKCRNTSSALNSSGATFIYMAFAENPFVSSTLIPTTAR